MKLRILFSGLAVMALLFGPMDAASYVDEPMSPTQQVMVDEFNQRMDRDPVAARAYIEELSDDDPMARSILAALLLNGVGGERDVERAMALLERGAGEGNLADKTTLATIALMEPGNPEDHARAVSILREADAADGYEHATLYPWARAYLFGWGVEQDLARGTALMELAVEAVPGNADAQFLMGRAYDQGWGVPPDHERAYHHMQRAADLGDRRAQWRVGMMFREGRGVTADIEQAYHHVRMSAEDGHLDGMISLAVMLATGEGVQVDEAEAREWYDRAARAGSAHALRGLGYMLLAGQGGAADSERGVAYLELAAEAGEVNAVRLLSGDFIDGLSSVDRDRVNDVKAEWIATYGPPS